MFSLTRQEACSICSVQIASPIRVYVCEPCFSSHLSELPQHVVKYVGFNVPCGCCLNPSAGWFAGSVWVCTCVPCKFRAVQEASKNKPSSKKSFLSLHPSPLSENFRGDVSFIVEGSDKPIHAHRFILASKSPVFQKMMELDMSEKLSGIIHINDISAPVVRAAINCMYTAELDFSEDVTALEMLRFAHRYDISWLREQCESELVNNINTDNILEMLSISNYYRVPTLSDEARKFFFANPDVHNHVLDVL